MHGMCMCMMHTGVAVSVAVSVAVLTMARARSVQEGGAHLQLAVDVAWRVRVAKQLAHLVGVRV